MAGRDDGAIVGAETIEESEVVVGELLGSGSFGRVYKGTCRGRPICIKVCLGWVAAPGRGARLMLAVCPRSLQMHTMLALSATSADSGLRVEADSSQYTSYVREIRREANMLAQLHSDRVLSFEGVVNKPGTNEPMYILFELAKGSLRWYLDTKPRLSLQEWKRIAVDVLHALDYLASKTIIHRDLKPANILVFESDDGHLTFKVGDVGLARVAARTLPPKPGDAATAASHGIAAAMTNAGTPLYTAPEVESGTYDQSVDMFSFGLVALEVLATHVVEGSTFRKYESPFQLPEMRECARKYLTELGLPELADLLASCVDTVPGKRPSANLTLSRLRGIELPGGVVRRQRVLHPVCAVVP